MPNSPTRLYIGFFFSLYSLIGNTQELQPYAVHTIAFYNVENLFDTQNDSLIFDDARTPEGAYHWTKERYGRKIENIAKVLSEVGEEISKTPPAIIGLCEVENRSVIEDVIENRFLVKENYGIVHFDSPDERGIDVALLFKKEVFIPNGIQKHKLILRKNSGFLDRTRDQLVVSGFLDGDPLYFIVNHWPSRSGGQLRSEPHRIAAARLNKRIVDSIRRVDPNPKIVSMGDLNDNPSDPSIKEVLQTKGSRTDLDSLSLYNPMEALYKKGAGSLAYRDKWHLFDQFICSAPMAQQPNNSGFTVWKAGIYNTNYLRTSSGRYRGYPFRTYAGRVYAGGYSDHFPVYLFLVKAINKN